VYWEKYLKLDPESSDAYYQMGLAQEKSGLTGKAIGSFEKALELNPENKAARLSAAGDYEKLGSTEQAAAHYEKYLELDPKNTSVLQHLGGYYYNQKKLDEAREFFQRAREANPGDDNTAFWLGVIAEEKKDYPAAIKYFEILAKNQQEPSVLTRLSYYYSLDKQYNKAVKVLKRVAEIDPDNPFSYYLLGLAYLDARDYSNAEKNLLKVIALKPDFYEVHFHLGVLYDSRNRFDKAQPELEKAIQLKPDFGSALNYLGYSLADRNIQLDRAEKLVKKALDGDPDNGAYMDSLGWVYFREGRYDEAASMLSAAAQKSPDPLINEHLGDAYVKLNRNSDAWDAYRKSVDADPKNSRASKKLKDLEKFLGPATLQRKVLKRAEGNLLQLKTLSAGFSTSGEFTSNNVSAFGRFSYMRPDKWRIDVLGSFFAPKMVVIQNKTLSVYPEAMKSSVSGIAGEFFGYMAGFFNGNTFGGFDNDRTVVSTKGDDFTFTSSSGAITISRKNGGIKEFRDDRILIKFTKSGWFEGLYLPENIEAYSLKDNASLKIRFSGFEVNGSMKEDAFNEVYGPGKDKPVP